MPAPKDPEKREQWLQRLSQSHMGKQVNLGRVFDDATKAKISATLNGRKITSEQRARQLEAIQRHTENITPEQREKMGWRKGAIWSEEIRRKISESNKGRIISEHVIQSAHSPEATAKRSAAHKRVWATMSPEERAQRTIRFVEAGRKGSRNQNTYIERFMARQLDSMHISYEKQKRIGIYAVDFFIAEYDLIIEVNGCFWHGCEECGFNDEMHYEKRAHDTKRIAYLESEGYTVSIYWEHELLPYIEERS